MTLSSIYCAFVAGVVCFQVALVFGAPWGGLTQGGQIKGALPFSRRVAALASAGLLIVMALAVLAIDRGWTGWPSWTGWPVVIVSALSMLMNWITPSKAERLLWGPVTTIMFLLVVAVVWL